MKKDEDKKMNDTKMMVNGKETVVKGDNKVCAILNTITASIWAFVAFMHIYGILFQGEKFGSELIFDAAMVILWGSIAIDYFIKYKKERKAQ